MRVGIATDQGSLELKEELVAQIHASGHEVVDFCAFAATIACGFLAKRITVVKLYPFDSDRDGLFRRMSSPSGQLKD
ncbi:MAG TPA: hypothetical protein DCP92_23285 [Nitrospiraceae bacterium]|jgi:hypothetical protein|nr:hypothetical protein [Nitrospiraceae bacterium]